jgi:hypothetical protein
VDTVVDTVDMVVDTVDTVVDTVDTVVVISSTIPHMDITDIISITIMHTTPLIMIHIITICIIWDVDKNVRY